MRSKLIILIAIAVGLGFLVNSLGLTSHQSLAVAIFSASILGTLFFWDFRLSFAFIGTALLLLTGTIDVPHVVEYSSLEVIFFLIGMMVMVALLRENNFFGWITYRLLSIRRFTALKFVLILSIFSALLSALVSEAVSIIFVCAMIFEVCDHYELDPVPYVIIAVLATNIGSAATVLGNPIGILIAAKSGLTFEDFIIKALPLAVVCLAACIGLCIAWYRKPMREMDAKIRQHHGSLPHHKSAFSGELKTSLVLFVLTLILISFHHRLELLLGLKPNTVLLTVPLIASGIVMVWKRAQARNYIEKDVEWWTLLFFLFLFAQAGTLQYTGATDVLGARLATAAGGSQHLLTGLILWISTVFSAILDNVVLVAALLPVVQGFKDVGLQPLYWALLFGGCLGGNITLVGSTANLIALGILEKQKNIRIGFARWFGIGLTVGVVTTVIVWAALVFIPFYR